jgi:hypothetical protein
MVAKGRRLVKRVEVESRGVSAAADNASLLALTHTVSLPPSMTVCFQITRMAATGRFC